LYVSHPYPSTNHHGLLTKMMIDISADTFLVFSFLLEVLTISLLVHVEMEEGVEVVVILASVAGFSTLFVSLIVLCAGNSPAKIIERDLRACSKAMAGVKN